LKSAITVPMLARNQAFGTITFVVAESGRYYNDVDLTLAMELASRVALAVENARLYQEAKKANEELEQRVIKRTAQLEAANKELEAFSYSVSHDLRAPLRGIDGFSQALLEDYADSLDGQAQHYLQRVRAASQRMAQLIDDLLMLSRLSRSEMRLESVDLSALAQSITAELHQLEPEREVKFLIAHDVTVQADKQLIRVVLENLLRNAWKFTAKHKVAHIEFGVSSQPNGQLAYFVRDDGAGFDMAYADKLFDAFQRLHTPAEFSGTGIGLATVQRIIHRHDGRVWGEGAVEKGASIYFTLSPFMAGEAGNRM
jgi:light-regulated signal transduction histidine kinase (bacteriophytochrome)